MIKRWTAVVRFVAIAYSSLFGALFLYTLNGGRIMVVNGRLVFVRLPLDLQAFEWWQVFVFILIVASPWAALEWLKLNNGWGLAWASCLICIAGTFTLAIGIIPMVASLKIWTAAEIIWKRDAAAQRPQYQ